MIWHGEDNAAGDSEMNKKERMTEEAMVIEHQRMDRNEVWTFPEGSRRQVKVERYCWNVIFGAPTTVKVKGLR